MNNCKYWRDRVIKINMNKTIKIKLTNRGKMILYEYWENKLKKHNSEKDVIEWVKSKIKKGYYEIELWQFMNIFGEHFYNGAEPISENNEIEITG